LYIHSQSAIHLATNLVYHSKTKHIDIKYHFVRYVIDGGGVDIKKVTLKKTCKHVYKTNVIREATVVFSFSWLAKEVMNELGKGMR
jgi:hypothetical protein